jgi:hypothetical protein
LGEAWGTLHLALLPTNEDRAEAVVDWAGAGMTHQRAGRITVETDEERDLAGAGKRAPDGTTLTRRELEERNTR